MPGNSTLLAVGGVANIVIALVRVVSIRSALDQSIPLPLGNDANRPSLVIVTLRAAFLHALFAAVTLGFPRELLTNGLGALIGIGIGGYLTLMSLEQFRLPEFKSYGLPIAAPVGALAYFGAYIA